MDCSKTYFTNLFIVLSYDKYRVLWTPGLHTECSDVSPPCADPLAECVNVGGTFLCQCKEGSPEVDNVCHTSNRLQTLIFPLFRNPCFWTYYGIIFNGSYINGKIYHMTKACYICLQIICNAHLFHTSPEEKWIQGIKLQTPNDRNCKIKR